jgi:hypothetical protein
MPNQQKEHRVSKYRYIADRAARVLESPSHPLLVHDYPSTRLSPPPLEAAVAIHGAVVLADSEAERACVRAQLRNAVIFSFIVWESGIVRRILLTRS